MGTPGLLRQHDRMPELPAVEFSRKLIANNIVGQCITEITAVPDKIIFANVPTNEFESKLKGKFIKDVHRHGKYLWIDLADSTQSNDVVNLFLLLHFGMTGFVEVRGTERLFYRSGPEEERTTQTARSNSWPPRFCKFHLTTDKNVSFAFGDSRRLGRALLLKEDPRVCEPVNKLGFDPILSMPPFDEAFIKLVHSRRKPIKALLLDQSFSAGVGNWMADDILLNAGIHPETITNELTINQLQRLHHSIRHISEVAISFDAEGSQFPEHWLFHLRWIRGKKRGEGKIKGHSVKFGEVDGRTTVWVPDLQKKKEVEIEADDVKLQEDQTINQEISSSDGEGDSPKPNRRKRSKK